MSTFLTKVIESDSKGYDVEGYYPLCEGCGEVVKDGVSVHGSAYCEESCAKDNGYTESELRFLWEQYTDESDCPIYYTDWYGAYTKEDYEEDLI